MPERPIRMSESQRGDLAKVCGLGAPMLHSIAQRIANARPTVRASELQAIISRDIDKNAGEAVSRVLFELAILGRRRSRNAEQIIEGVGTFIVGQWSAEQLGQWQDCRQALTELLGTQSVILVAKATDLSFDLERFCTGTRIITDIRPVYDDPPGDDPKHEILGTTIKQTLRMEFMGVDGTISSISVGMDADDITRLQKACADALNKAKVAREKLKEWQLPEAIIPGEDLL